MFRRVAWLLLLIIVLGGCGDSKPDKESVSSDHTDSAISTGIPAASEVERALAELKRADQVVDQRWRDALAKAYAAIDISSPEAQRLKDLYLAVEKTGGYPPAAPGDAETIHMAFCEAVAARMNAIEVIQSELDNGQTKALDQIKKLQDQAIELRSELKLSDAQIAVLTNPQSEWKAEQYEITVDARQNPFNSRSQLDRTFKPGDVLYLFPSPNDKWYTGRYKWVDFRGRMAGAGKAPTMKLRSRFNKVIPGHTEIGQRLIVLSPGQIEFYCEDRWPESNEGSIRVTVVAMRP